MGENGDWALLPVPEKTGGVCMDNLVSVKGNFSSSINFSMQQNYVPVIRDLVIQNETQEPLTDLELRIEFEPEFAQVFVYPIGTLAPGAALEISPVKLQLQTELLFSLTERLAGTVLVTVSRQGSPIYTFSQDIALLAYDEWSGLDAMPELIAAFVTPNHPALSAVIHDAALLLEQWNQTPSFTGYQTQNPNQVKLQMAALYTALAQQGIGYTPPPASFEESGQRVRLPHAVLEQKSGTCLDLAVLYASCLEAVGLHSLIFFTDGHAFCGCWLEDSTFADCVIDDLAAIEKRLASGAQELMLSECTDFVAGKAADFDSSVLHALDHLRQEGNFLCAVDIQRTRGSGIRPIPLRLEGETPTAQGYAQDISTQAPNPLDASLLGRTLEGTAQPLTKSAIWERKLLDLSLRNTLLNFRVTKNAIQLMAHDLAELENKLSDGKDFQILEVPSEWTLSPRDARMYALENSRDLNSGMAAEEFKNGRIRSFLKQPELENNLKGLYRSAKTSLEENGGNTLFLALGLLRWYESELSEKARYAPLVLIPVDLVRSIRSRGYLMRSRQEDAQINVTLLEYLRQDQGLVIDGLDPLPHDDHGIDLPLVFHTLRQAVMSKKRWNIEDMAFLGLFSFGQFVMWNDLRSRSQELRTSEVVSSLMDGHLTWTPEENPISPENLDETIDSREMAIPVSADSSQMVAIAAAAAGRSFVLHGPPGTGKSQTITNIIANALYQGKSVLFVAEKMAALTVVQKRLAAIGLDPFCLELHSNKTKKSTVLEQLEKSLEVGRVRSPEEYTATAQHLHELRAQLNHIITALHQRRSWGGSLYGSIQLFQPHKELLGSISFDSVPELTKQTLDDWEGRVHRYAVAAEEIGSYSDHPLRGVGLTAYSMDTRERFRRETQALLAQTDKLGADCDTLLRWMGGKKDQATVEALLATLRALALPGQQLPNLLTAPDYTALSKKLRQLISSGRDYQARHAALSGGFDPAVFDYPVQNARLRWKQAENAWLLSRLAGQNKLVRELRLYANDPATVTKETLPGLYEELAGVASLRKEIQETPLSSLLGHLFLGVQTDWGALEQALEKANTLRKLCGRIPGVSLETAVQALDSVPTGIASARRRIEDFLASQQAYTTRFAVDLRPAQEQEDWPQALAQVLERYAANSGALRDLAMFNQADTALREAGLENVSSAYLAGTVNARNLPAAFRCNLHYSLAMEAIQADSRLSQFHSKQYDDCIALFEQTINNYRSLTIQELAARLSAKVPTSGIMGAASSEIGILKRAIKSGGRNLSLRRLFDQIPTLLRRLCPCMLMSPISVAQYIDPAFPKFDLVIFDEASQLPTSEAVGAIARGNSVVVVGDPKQLPPTSFFTANGSHEDDCEMEDLESLLDDCLAISMPQEYLKWHYRSRHESLIAYSNMKYYDNKLYTFPSPNDLTSQVRFISLEGSYDKGKTKQNRAEAEAIVAEIIRRLSDETLRRDSIGVVTFSAVQQNLIDDLLCEQWEQHPELEELNRASPEPIFIKNLENVQGDERDVILFSVGYGPDEHGYVSMNFGPLNRDGGWRRLNVAISRARKFMAVYSVLRPGQIDLSRTRSEGVAGLKGFLEYAQSGKTAVAQRSGLAPAQEDQLVDQIADAISALGYRVERNIGCSSFKVDIGIVNPEQPDTFLLGILLDGENSKSSATAQDRFVLQPSVLEGLGWSILRLWTLDWLDDPQRVIERIQSTIQSLRQPEETPPDSPEAPKPQSFESFAFEKETAPKTLAVPYVSAQLPILGTPEDFYLPSSKRKIRSAVSKILDAEAPISRKLLVKKLIAAWSMTRSGSRVEAIVDQVLTGIPLTSTQEGEREFLWKEGQDPAEYEIFRDASDFKRNMEDIPCQELLNAMAEVLREQISLSDSDLLRETARKFSYTRTGGQIEAILRDAMLQGLSDGRIAQAENGSYKLPEGAY